MNTLVTMYFVAIVLQIAIRARFTGMYRQATRVERRITARERTSLAALSIGLLLVPIVYATTDWLAFADYRLPPASGRIGLALLAASLFVFWRGHVDLGANWSPTLEIRERHELVERGIYSAVRHPMYASLLLWSLAQPLLLQNFVAGLLGPLTFALFYRLRVGPEEQMMLDTFGDRYRDYMRRVGGIVPKV